VTDTRLRWLSADLADRLKDTSAEKRRQVVLAACSRAVDHSGLTDQIASSVLARLKAGDEIDGLARRDLDGLAAAWDKEAWKEVDSTHTGDLSVHAASFNKARAANALVYALDQGKVSQDSWLAAAEAIYEALVCLDDDPKGAELARIMDKILS
jgi:hypothetical protein